MPKSWGRTYVTLIPKREHPKMVSDFRPISLCNVSYKIMSKILANRLNYVLNNLISNEQSGFLSGRSPLNNVIAVQEMAHSINQDRSYTPRMILKIDIEKAYDSLNWNAILATFARMGFPSPWIAWIRALLDAVTFSILVNGQPSNWITPSRGVRQGDPISPYLFIIVSQNLSVILNRARNIDMIPGFDKNLHYNFNHLMYADDLILISHATRRIARNIKFCLAIYAAMTGQYFNSSKSAIYFPEWFNRRVALSIKNILEMEIGHFPFKYLGVIISHKKLARTQF